MSIELTLLVWSTVLFGLYIGAQATLYRMQHGVIHAATARDNDTPPSVMSGRAERALRNLIETYGVFIALAMAIEITGRSDALTVWGAQLYFWARIAYLPLYLFGVQYIRSLVWSVSALGLLLMFVGILF